ncbi:DUF63 family protein [Candidatus Micrarchaeota archaeon]|jgi:uncharacterized membrane protein|nr:DUF63 family protein [Candidatus Micrarchaeota archaeon]
MIDFIKTYFWDYLWLHKGYNLYNTVAYAIIALVALFFLYKWFRKNHKIDNKFLTALISFILFGSTFRVVVDSYDIFGGTSRAGEYIASGGFFAPLYEFIASTNIYNYSPITVTPGIYILTAFLFLISILIERKFKISAWMIGGILWVIHFIILIPLITYPAYLMAIILLASLATLFVYFVLKKDIEDKNYMLGVFGHALDGAGTFIIIDVFNKLEPACKLLGRCYGEQHVLPGFLGDNYGYILFFALKVLISAIAVKIIVDEKKITKEDALFFIAVLMTLGLAPGVRNMLRIMVGA